MLAIMDAWTATSSNYQDGGLVPTFITNNKLIHFIIISTCLWWMLILWSEC